MDFSTHPIIKDFNLFLNYLTARPKLSLTIEKGVLKHVDLFALNRQMSSFTSHWIQPRSNQDDFTLLNTFFYIAEASELIIAQGNQRNSKKELIFNPKRLKAYAELTDAEKYFFLLETFWCFMDWDNAYEIRSFGDFEFYKHIISAPVGKKVTISDIESKRKGELRRPSNFQIVEMFVAFGFLELEPDETIEKKPKRFSFPYKTVALTEFGAILLAILLDKRPTYQWQREGRLRDHTWSDSDYKQNDEGDDYEYTDVLLMEDGDEDEADTSMEDGDTPQANLKVYQTKDLYEEEDADDYDFTEENMDNAANTDENFEDAFLPYLQGVTIQKRLMPLPTDLISGLYRLKVVLDKETHRIIEIGGNHTFDDLHLMIQHIFGLDNDHLYTFFMDGRRWSQSADRYASPHCLDEVPATAIKIGQVGLFEGKNFLYLFDFGDEWEFKIWVEAISPDADEPENPILISAVGDNPEQYPDYEEEEED
jgi:hypothetical protein